MPSSACRASPQLDGPAKTASQLCAIFDRRYLRVEALLENVNYLITSKEFPEGITGESNLLKSLPMIHANFNFRLTTATRSGHGVTAWDARAATTMPEARR
ncbi:MAG: hypothetical protein ACRD4X_10360 [Candidatus Acidiferrales bacterium]